MGVRTCGAKTKSDSGWDALRVVSAVGVPHG